ncbi:MAG: hypothetical protein AB7V43_17945 [Acidimicrobiia bacterium]
MTIHVRLRFAAAVLAPLALVMAACGGSSSPKADPEADTATAKKAIAALETALAADGFVGSPSDDEDDPLELTSQECKKFNQFFDENSIEGKTADVDSQSFDRGDLGGADDVSESVQGNAIVVSDAKAFDKEFEVLEDPALPDCVAEAFEQGFSESSSDESTELTLDGLESKRPDSIDGTDHSTGISVSATINAEGQSLPIVLDVRWASKGRYGMMLMTSTFGDDTSSIDGEALVTLALDTLTGKG